MPWTIKGEAGQALDATVRTFESLRIEAAELRFQSLADDTFTWTAKTDNAAGAGTIIPSIGQVVEIFLDGARKFRGHVTKPRVRMDSISVEVVGPWWWMTRTPLTSNQIDSVGATSERQKYLFATGDLTGMITTLINRAITNGVPMVNGGVAATYPMSKITLSEMTCAEALASLMSRAADMGTFFDYSQASGTLPIIYIVRRGAIGTLTLTVGADAIETLDLSPRLDLEVTRVELKFVDRDPTTGKPRFQGQADGTAAAGKRQIVTVSGPEIVDFLPIDDFAVVPVQSFYWSSLPASFFIAGDPGLAAIQKSLGGVFGEISQAWTYWTGDSRTKTAVTRTFPWLALRSVTGQTIPPANLYFVASPTPLPEWAQMALGAVEVEIIGTWTAAWRDSQQGTQPWSATFMAMQAGAQTVSSVWENSQNSSGTGLPTGLAAQQVDWLARPIALRGWLINRALTALTNIYKPWDYDYLQPPAGMAAGIRASQAWVPWEGEVTTVTDGVAGGNLTSLALNVVGTLPACATMRAMMRGCSHDIMRGRTTIELGAPARIDFGTAMGRVAISPQDVIIEL